MKREGRPLGTADKGGSATVITVLALAGVVVAWLAMGIEGIALARAGEGRTPVEWAYALLLYGWFGFLVGALSGIARLLLPYARGGGSPLSSRFTSAAAIPIFIVSEVVAGFWINRSPRLPAGDSIAGFVTNLAVAVAVLALSLAITRLLRRRLVVVAVRIERGRPALLLLLSASALVLLGILLVVPPLLSPPPGDAPPGAKPVIVILVDTLRRDHLGCYGYPKGTSPEIDRLASEGILFLDSGTVGCRTVPSLGTLFTGTYPSAHGLLGQENALGQESETLPERFRASGYRTAGILCNPVIRPQMGFDRGFDLFLPPRFPFLFFGRKTALEMLAIRLVRYDFSPGPDEAVPRALAWLAEGGRPPFLYLHLLTPHSPYEPPRKDAALFLPPGSDARHRIPPRIGPYEEKGRWQTWDEVVQPPRLPERERRIMTALYDGEIHFVDRWLGRLFRGVRDLGIYDDALLVFLADHGEEFLDHGGWFHGRSFFEEMCGMPLIVKLPGGAGAGVRAALSVDMVDLFPTLCSLAGIDTPEDVQGENRGGSILEIARRGAPIEEETIAFAEEPPHLYAMRAGRWKLIRRVGEERAVDRLFDLAADPGEKRDVVAGHPEIARRLGRLLERFVAASTARAGEGRGAGAVDPSTRDRLRALGYVE